MSALISRIRDLESDCNVIKAERDRLAAEAEKASKSFPAPMSSDPSMVNLTKDLETTRQQLAEATRQVQLLASCVKELEKVSGSSLFKWQNFYIKNHRKPHCTISFCRKIMIPKQLLL